MNERIVFGVVRFDVQAGLPVPVPQEIDAARNRLIEFEEFDNGVVLQHHVAFCMKEVRPGRIFQEPLHHEIVCAVRIGSIGNTQPNDLPEIVLQ